MVAVVHFFWMGSWHGAFHEAWNAAAYLIDGLALVLVLLTPSRRFQYGWRSKILTLLVWGIAGSVSGFYIPAGALFVWPAIIDRSIEHRHPVASG